MTVECSWSKERCSAVVNGKWPSRLLGGLGRLSAIGYSVPWAQCTNEQRKEQAVDPNQTETNANGFQNPDNKPVQVFLVSNLKIKG